MTQITDVVSMDQIVDVVSIDQLVEAVESDDYLGYCILCGAEHDGIEPDARAYECQCCGEAAVYGAGELLLLMTVAWIKR